MGLQNLTTKEISRILGGLRLLQTRPDSAIDDIVTNDGEYDKPEASEIDELCEKLNMREALNLEIPKRVERTGTRWEYRCPKCGSEEIVSDASGSWNKDAQRWELSSTYDNTTCLDCDYEADFGFEVTIQD